MSFGWSVGDIASAASILSTIILALKDSGGASDQYQDTTSFLASLEKTLTGIQALLNENPDLKWQSNLTQQASLLQNAIEGFRKKIAKYELSLGADTSRSKARTIPRKVQFTLVADVEKLRVEVSQPQQVLDVFINLQALQVRSTPSNEVSLIVIRSSILELSKTSSLSFATIEGLTKDLSHLLPSVTDGVVKLNRDIQSNFGEVKKKQLDSEVKIRDDLRAVQSHLTRMVELQKTINEQQSKWRDEFQLSIEQLRVCATKNLEGSLDQRVLEPGIGASGGPLEPREASQGTADRSEGGGRRNPNEVPSQINIQSIVAPVLQIIGSGIAGSVGALVALATQNVPSEEVHKWWACCKCEVNNDGDIWGYCTEYCPNCAHEKCKYCALLQGY